MSARRLLTRARRQAGLTQRELADLTGIPQPAIARIERGHTVPRLDTLERLLAGTGTAIEVGPIIGAGVDRSLIRAALARSPEDRVLAAGHAGRNLSAFLAEVQPGSRR